VKAPWNPLLSNGTPPAQNSCKEGCNPAFVNAPQCTPGPLPRAMRRGLLPLVIPTCPGDTVTQYGRINAIWVPEYVLWNAFGRAADYSPISPPSDSDVKAAADLDLTLTAVEGDDFLFPGIVLDVYTSNNVAPGMVTAVIAGTFENGSAWSQTVTLSLGHQGTSRYIILSSREIQGGAYPALFRVSGGIPVLETGVDNPIHIDGGALQQLLFLASPTSPPRTLTVTITKANIGTNFYVEALSPVSELWNWAMSLWYASAEASQ